MSPRNMAFVALGANLGDPGRNVLLAMDRLEALSRIPLVRSSLWKSAPVDCPPGSPPFVNAVVGLEPLPGETAISLLGKLKQLESEFGRKPKHVHNESRPLDLDLVTFRSEVCSGPELILPHPRVHLRAFVLQPLNELAPELVLPGFSQTVAELLVAMPRERGVEPMGRGNL